MIYYCAKCNEAFENRKQRKYCSWSCYQSAHSVPARSCVVCSNTFKSNRRATETCSATCAGVLISKSKTQPRLKIDELGYSVLSRKGKSLREHRYVWESNYGPIPDGWVIHHINEIRTDNRIENLLAMPRRHHQLIHNRNIDILIEEKFKPVLVIEEKKKDEETA